jgi:hypothetical protein
LAALLLATALALVPEQIQPESIHTLSALGFSPVLSAVLPRVPQDEENADTQPQVMCIFSS